MKKTLILLVIALLGTTQLTGAQAEMANPRVRLETTHGHIILELDPKAAPKTVENFLTYARNGFYDGTIFHRVIKGFMIQGGGLSRDMHKKQNQSPIQNEADNGYRNRRGTVAMARTNLPHSATSQFFINTVDNPFLDHTGKTPRGWGYCVFGKVVKGMHVVDQIERLPTGVKAGRRDVPLAPPVINRVVLETKGDEDT